MVCIADRARNNPPDAAHTGAQPAYPGQASPAQATMLRNTKVIAGHPLYTAVSRQNFVASRSNGTSTTVATRSRTVMDMMQCISTYSLFRMVAVALGVGCTLAAPVLPEETTVAASSNTNRDKYEKVALQRRFRACRVPFRAWKRYARGKSVALVYYIRSSCKLPSGDGWSGNHGAAAIPPAPGRVAPDTGAPEIGVRDGGRYEKPASQEPTGKWAAGASPRIGLLLLRFVKIGVFGSASGTVASAWLRLVGNDFRRALDTLCSAVVTE